MRILHITSHLNVGGVTSSVLTLCRGLTQRGHRVLIASGGGELEASARNAGSELWLAPLHTSAEWSLQIWGVTHGLARRLRETPVDLLHAHTRVGQVVADRLAHRLRVPYVATWHGFFRPNLGRWLWPCTGDRTIAISAHVRQHLLNDFRVPKQRIRVVHNGVDADYFAHQPNGDALEAFRARWQIPTACPIIGQIGRLASGGVKGLDVLLAAAQQLRQDIPNLHLLIVGEGPRRAFLETCARRFGLHGHVHFLGSMTDVRVPLALMDVFVFPSRWREGFGLSLVEAMAAGRPVVATRNGATPEIVEHGRSGWLVPPEDPEALADAIRQVLQDPAAAAQRAACAQARVRTQFTVEQMAERVEAVYGELLGQETARPPGDHERRAGGDTGHVSCPKSLMLGRILVVLPNWYGETLFATPFLRALRRQRPAAFIATLGWPQCREVLQHNPDVNELLEYDERGAHRSLAGKCRLLQTLRARRFDAAFILRKSLSRSLLLALAGIPTRVGFANVKSGWCLTRRVPRETGPRHKAFTYLPLLEAVGLTAEASAYHYTVSEEERRAAQAWRNAHLAGGDTQPIVILHPGANWMHKRWPPERFAALGDRLAADQQAYIVITGGPSDVILAESIQRQMRQPATLLAGSTSLRELAASLEQAQLVVSNDTGVLHIAAALRRPVVALYGPTSPALTGPLGDPQRTVVLHHADCCPQIPCYAPDRPVHPGMNSISVEEAYRAACQLLEQNQ